jgi:hypothetical protein
MLRTLKHLVTCIKFNNKYTYKIVYQYIESSFLFAKGFHKALALFYQLLFAYKKKLLFQLCFVHTKLICFNL